MWLSWISMERSMDPRNSEGWAIQNWVSNQSEQHQSMSIITACRSFLFFLLRTKPLTNQKHDTIQPFPWLIIRSPNTCWLHLVTPTNIWKPNQPAANRLKVQRCLASHIRQHHRLGGHSVIFRDNWNHYSKPWTLVESFWFHPVPRISW